MYGRTRYRFSFLVVLLLAGSALTGMAQEPRIKFLDDLCFWNYVSTRNPWEERIETERHDFTQSAVTVGQGVSQVEMGYTYFYRDAAEEVEQSHTTPEFMVRVGLTDDIEFRVRWDYAWSFVNGGGRADSAEDLRYAFKLGVTGQDGWIPESAIELRSTVPTGGRAFSTDHIEWGVDYIYDWKLTEKCRFYGSTGVMSNGLGDFGLLPEEPADERFLVWSQSFAIGLEVTQRTTLYAEVFGLLSHNLIEDYSNAYYNVGVDYYVTDDFVIDARVGAGLTPDADDLFAGIGGGVRF